VLPSRAASAGFWRLIASARAESCLPSLHDALPRSKRQSAWYSGATSASVALESACWNPQNRQHASSKVVARASRWVQQALSKATDRKSTRLNSSHVKISYAVFRLKKKILYNGGRAY